MNCSLLQTCVSRKQMFRSEFYRHFGKERTIPYFFKLLIISWSHDWLNRLNTCNAQQWIFLGFNPNLRRSLWMSRAAFSSLFWFSFFLSIYFCLCRSLWFIQPREYEMSNRTMLTKPSKNEIWTFNSTSAS